MRLTSADARQILGGERGRTARNGAGTRTRVCTTVRMWTRGSQPASDGGHGGVGHGGARGGSAPGEAATAGVMAW